MSSKFDKTLKSKITAIKPPRPSYDKLRATNTHTRQSFSANPMGVRQCWLQTIFHFHLWLYILVWLQSACLTSACLRWVWLYALADGKGTFDIFICCPRNTQGRRTNSNQGNSIVSHHYNGYQLTWMGAKLGQFIIFGHPRSWFPWSLLHDWQTRPVWPIYSVPKFL